MFMNKHYSYLFKFYTLTIYRNKYVTLTLDFALFKKSSHIVLKLFEMFMLNDTIICKLWSQ